MGVVLSVGFRKLAITDELLQGVVAGLAAGGLFDLGREPVNQAKENVKSFLNY